MTTNAKLALYFGIFALLFVGWVVYYNSQTQPTWEPSTITERVAAKCHIDEGRLYEATDEYGRQVIISPWGPIVVHEVVTDYGVETTRFDCPPGTGG